MRQFKRSKRVGSQMLRDVRNVLELECATNLTAMITFTDVEVSDDLRYATIYYSVLGDDKQKTEASRYFNKNRGKIQFKLGRLLNIKVIPEITFEFDPSIEQGMRIEQLLNKISEEDEHKNTEDI
ncbi:MAG: 30S ribosome-binding factor RbfA [candidate division Zixibacteria bacterium]|nr:30S ribosome-binding factor RbfA [candidate division Zixibacteria bacterium]